MPPEQNTSARKLGIFTSALLGNIHLAVTNEDVLDFNSLGEGDVVVSDNGDDLVFEVVGNGGHTVSLRDIQAEDLNLSNLTADDWNSIDEANSALVIQLEALGMSIA